jgi:hypothetical protein
MYILTPILIKKEFHFGQYYHFPSGWKPENVSVINSLIVSRGSAPSLIEIDMKLLESLSRIDCSLAPRVLTSNDHLANNIDNVRSSLEPIVKDCNDSNETSPKKKERKLSNEKRGFFAKFSGDNGKEDKQSVVYSKESEREKKALPSTEHSKEGKKSRRTLFGGDGKYSPPKVNPPKSLVPIEFTDVVLKNFTQIEATSSDGWIHTFRFINETEIHEITKSAHHNGSEERRWISLEKINTRPPIF